ncbi:MAG: hypothetical protein HUU23_07950 [Caldilineales bacterium]|nr:hypothetical protein [Caldilineales bacterium]
MERSLPTILWIFPFLFIAIGIYTGVKAWSQFRNPTSAEKLVSGKYRWRYDFLSTWILRSLGIDPFKNMNEPRFIRAVAMADMMRAFGAIILGLFMLILFSGVLDSSLFDF